ncbi:MAG: serine/threonine protein kinase [Mariniblastus sp.]
MSNDSFNDDLADYLEDDDAVYEEMAAIEEKCEEYIQLYRLGQAPTHEEFAARFPDVSSQILDILPTVVAIEDARKKNLVKRNDGRVARGPEAVPTLGDYQIVREIGRGGMGIVYEANQASLDRRVAIKVLPKFSLTDLQIEKFHNEAQMAAKLHHSNIAPVFDVGEKDGLHYYVMQLLNGDSLDAYVPYFESEETLPLLEELSQEEVVQVGLQVSSALSYAHSHNVLHRDIKPANLILDPDYNVWVTDFGLARTESNINANIPSTYTTTGKIVGTLRYIAPECIEGELGDARSDVYSLGVTLIELFSGKPAFEETNQADVISQIRTGNFNIVDREEKRLPKDLTAILKKTVATNPADRYMSASELNQDLDSYVNGRPVIARSGSAFSSAWKWIQRNPEISLASAVAATLMLTTLFILTVSFLRIENVLESERNQRVTAETNSKLAAQAMDRMFSQFSNGLNDTDSQLVEFDGTNTLVAELPQPRITNPRLTKETATMLEELSSFYIQLAAKNNHDSDLKVKAMMARNHVGELHSRLGQYNSAIESFRIAINGYQKLIERGFVSDDTESMLQVARFHNRMGVAMKMKGDVEAANQEHNKAFRLLQTHQSDTSQQKSNIQIELARSLFLSAYATRPGMGPASLPTVGFSSEAVNSNRNMQRDGGLDPTKKNLLSRAVEILTTDQATGSSPSRDHLLGACYRELASDNWSTREQTDRKFHAQSVEIFETLSSKLPNELTFQFELMRTLAEINVFEPQIAKPVLITAKQSLEQAVEIGKRLVTSEPDVSMYRVELVHANFKLAQISRQLALESSGENQNALYESEERHLRQSLTEQAFLSRQYPESSAYKVWIARFTLSLSKCNTMRPRQKNRNRLITRAIGILNRLPDAELSKPEVAAIMDEAKKLSHDALMDSEED